MSATTDRLEPADSGLEALAEEVRQLRDLFQRRLLEDKAKNRLYEELYAQLELARGDLARQLLAPLFHELLLVIDRITTQPSCDDRVLPSVVDELTEILARRDVRPLPASDRFDAAQHDIVRTEHRTDRPAGAILEVSRTGYLFGQQLLRPSRVVVAAPPASTDDAPR